MLKGLLAEFTDNAREALCSITGDIESFSDIVRIEALENLLHNKEVTWL